MGRFSGQTAIVTGAAQGLGWGIAQRLAAEGAAVALWDRDAPQLRSRVGELTQLGRRCWAWPCDVTREAEVAAGVARVVAASGRVEVLATAAGINGNTTARTHELPLADFEQVLEINLRGTFLCVRAVLPAMLSAGYGRIVTMASIAGKEGNPGMLAYSASKAGIIGLTKVVGKEYAAQGIVCNAIAPALVRTPATETVHSAERFRELAARIPMGRTGRVEEVAAAVAYVASPECSFTTGFTFDASGGRAVF